MTDTDTPLSEAELDDIAALGWSHKSYGGRLLADVRRLRAALLMVNDAAVYDAQMDGVKHMGWKRKQLDQALPHVRAALGMKENEHG